MTEERDRQNESRRSQERDPELRDQQRCRQQDPSHREGQPEIAALGENHEARRQEVEALLHRERPTRLNYQLRAVKQGVRQSVIRHNRPGRQTRLQPQHNAQEQKIDGIDAGEPVHEIFRQPINIKFHLFVINTNYEKAAQGEEKRHHVEGVVRIRRNREMVEENDRGPQRPYPCQGGILLATQPYMRKYGHGLLCATLIDAEGRRLSNSWAEELSQIKELRPPFMRE